MSNYVRGLRPYLVESLGEFLDTEFLKIEQAFNRVSYMSIFVDGTPTAGQQLVRTKLGVPLKLFAGDFICDAGVAATADAVFSIKVDGSTVGTITFGSGQTTGSVSITAPNIPALSLFEVYAPSIADATLADVTLAIALLRES